MTSIPKMLVRDFSVSQDPTFTASQVGNGSFVMSGTATSPDLRRVFAEHAAAEPERQLFERGIHPAAGERMAHEQPALHFLYRAIDAETVEIDKQALRAWLLAQWHSHEVITEMGYHLARLEG